MFLDERLHEILVAAHGGQVQRGQADLGARVDERLVREQGVADLEVALLGCQMERSLTVAVKHVHPAEWEQGLYGGQSGRGGR